MKNHEKIIVAQLSNKNDLKLNKHSLANEDICLVKANVFNQFWCGRLRAYLTYFTVHNLSFPFRISSVNVFGQPQETRDLVTFTEKILNGKLYFFMQCFSHW